MTSLGFIMSDKIARDAIIYFVLTDNDSRTEVFLISIIQTKQSSYIERLQGSYCFELRKFYDFSKSSMTHI